MAHSKHCYGPSVAKVKHKPECRPGRPLCRWRRAARWGICSCSCYHFPHRAGSGACATGVPAGLFAPMRKGVAL